jgi:Protein of unknown function (DUF3300)
MYALFMLKSRKRWNKLILKGTRVKLRSLAAMLSAALLMPGQTLTAMPSLLSGKSLPQTETAKISAEQLDSLVAPIALYPDPLLAQTLAASTYPLEIVQLQQWLARNSNLKDKALADAVAKQPWDPSVQALAGLPEMVKRLANEIQWTTDLGNAFLAQQSDIMDAVQRMRKRASEKGQLKSTEQQKVETKVVESKQVIVIEQANPEVVYLPSYDPVVVWGAPYYPYPPIYYPGWGYYAGAAAISFGIGFAMGAFWGGGWGWGCGWGGNDININRNNNFNRNTNIGGRNQVNPLGNRGGGAGGNKWQHNPSHRGGAPYKDRATADRFGGTTRGDSLANRQAGARQQVGRQGGSLPSNRAGAGVSNRASGPGSSGIGAGASNRAGSAGTGNRAGGGGADRIGSHDLSRSGGGDRSAFGGGTDRYSGSSSRQGSSRGSSSSRSSGGGGFSGGGGGSRGGGGGGRGGGGGGRR